MSCQRCLKIPLNVSKGIMKMKKIVFRMLCISWKRRITAARDLHAALQMRAISPELLHIYKPISTYIRCLKVLRSFTSPLSTSLSRKAAFRRSKQFSDPEQKAADFLVLLGDIRDAACAFACTTRDAACARASTRKKKSHRLCHDVQQITKLKRVSLAS